MGGGGEGAAPGHKTLISNFNIPSIYFNSLHANEKKMKGVYSQNCLLREKSGVPTPPPNCYSPFYKLFELEKTQTKLHAVVITKHVPMLPWQITLQMNIGQFYQ